MRAATAWTVLALLVLTALGTWATRPRTIAPGDIPQHVPNPDNGERLFHAGGCASCHGANLAGGLSIASPVGTFRVPNITPDPQAGIGRWGLRDFIDAMKFGVSPAGKHYYPAFPYTSYTRMTLTDLIDLKAYIDTLAPVAAEVPGHRLRFPWNIRRGIGLWKRLYLDPRPVVPIPSGDTALERGRYLVESAGHCAECHTSRNRLGALQTAYWLAGAPSLDGEGRVPNITPHADGLADWSERDIVRYLKSGFTPDYDTVGGSMTEVQENLAQLPDDDLAAIAAYLKAVPPLPNPADRAGG
jgi:mono/diheme cytochrome c family protein